MGEKKKVKLKCAACEKSCFGFSDLKKHIFATNKLFNCEICKTLIVGDEKLAFNLCNIKKDYDKKYCSLQENNFFVALDSKLYELDRKLPLSLTGNISISGEKFEPKFYVMSEENNNDDDSSAILLGKHVIAFRDFKWTVRVIDDLILSQKTTRPRPNQYFEYCNDLTNELKNLKVQKVENRDFGHLATSCYAHDEFDSIFRNMHINLTLMDTLFNRQEFWALERGGLHEAKRRSAHDSFKKLVREFILLHDDDCTHPLGDPKFVLAIYTFVYDDKFEVKIYALPNGPLKMPFEFFEITMSQFEEIFQFYLLNEVNYDNLREKEFHRNTRCTDQSVTSEELKLLLSLSKNELIEHPLLSNAKQYRREKEQK